MIVATTKAARNGAHAAPPTSPATLAGQGVDARAEDVAHDEEQQQPGADDPLEVRLRPVHVRVRGFCRAHRDSPRRSVQRTALPHNGLAGGDWATTDPPLQRHRSRLVTVQSRDRRAGSPSGVGSFPHYPAAHADSRCAPDGRWLRPVPVLRRRCPDRDLRRHRPRHRADRLPARLPRPAHRQQHRDRSRGARRRGPPAPLRREPDRQQPGQAHQRRRLPQARPDRRGRDGAGGGGRAAAGRRRRHPAHHRRRRHQHRGGRPGGVPPHAGLGAHRRRPAEDHRQRHRADPAEPRRADRGPAGVALRPERARRARLQPADADRARGDGPRQRLADGRGGARLHGLARRAAVAARHRPRPAPLGDPRGLRPRARHRPRRRGRPAARGDGRGRLRQHLPRRGRRASTTSSPPSRRPARPSGATRSAT